MMVDVTFIDCHALCSPPDTILRRFEAEDARLDPSIFVRQDLWEDFQAFYEYKLHPFRGDAYWHPDVVSARDVAHSVESCGWSDFITSNSLAQDDFFNQYRRLLWKGW
jgi:hypothetical protein